MSIFEDHYEENIFVKSLLLKRRKVNWVIVSLSSRILLRVYICYFYLRASKSWKRNYLESALTDTRAWKFNCKRMTVFENARNESLHSFFNLLPRALSDFAPSWFYLCVQLPHPYLPKSFECLVGKECWLFTTLRGVIIGARFLRFSRQHFCSLRLRDCDRTGIDFLPWLTIKVCNYYYSPHTKALDVHPCDPFDLHNLGSRGTRLILFSGFGSVAIATRLGLNFATFAGQSHRKKSQRLDCVQRSLRSSLVHARSRVLSDIPFVKLARFDFETPRKADRSWSIRHAEREAWSKQRKRL